jgi:hypothetical protein
MQRQVDELTRQRDSITSHLAQLRQLLGGAALPGMEPEPAVTAAPPKPALAAPASEKPAAPAPAKQEAKADDDAEWWQE